MRLALVALLILLAGPVAAHSTLPGFGGFYSGAFHLVATLPNLLLLLAFGLLAGRLTQILLGWTVLALLAGLSVGLLTQPFSSELAEQVILSLTVAGGLLLALNFGLPPVLAVVFGLGSGLLIGADADVIVSAIEVPGTWTFVFAGTLTGALILFLNAVAAARFLAGKGWSIVWRVAGSWIATVAALAVALKFWSGPGIG